VTNAVNVVNGEVMGYARLDPSHQACEFSVCTIEEYEVMTETEASAALVSAMRESGILDLYY